MLSTFGKWLESSFYGVTGASSTFFNVSVNDYLGNFASTSLQARCDGYSVVSGDFVNPDSYSVALHSVKSTAVLTSSRIRTKPARVASRFQVTTNMSTYSRGWNMNGIALTYYDAADDVDFSNTGARSSPAV